MKRIILFLFFNDIPADIDPFLDKQVRDFCFFWGARVSAFNFSEHVDPPGLASQ